MKLPGWPVLLQLPRAWLALRAARARLARSSLDGLTLGTVAPRRARIAARPLARAIFGLGRRQRGSACLAQSIALADVLRAHGYPAQVVIGAARDAGAFRAHAWVECEGQTFDPQPAQLSALTRVRAFGAPLP